MIHFLCMFTPSRVFPKCLMTLWMRETLGQNKEKGTRNRKQTQILQDCKHPIEFHQSLWVCGVVTLYITFLVKRWQPFISINTIVTLPGIEPKTFRLPPDPLSVRILPLQSRVETRNLIQFRYPDRNSLEKFSSCKSTRKYTHESSERWSLAPVELKKHFSYH